MRFVHTADLHIGITPEAGSPWAKERADSIKLILPKVIEICKNENADLLFISGDLFQRQPLSGQLKEAAYLFSKLEKTKVVIIAGNHDYLSEDCPYLRAKLGENVTLLSSRELSSVYFPELNTEVHGFSYYGNSIKEPLYDSLRAPKDGRIHVLLAHGGDADHVPISYKALSEAGFDYVALGHIHQPRVFKGTRLAYSGSPEPLDCTDIGERGCLVGEITEDSFNLRWKPMAETEYKKTQIEVSPATTEAEIRDRINETLWEKPLDLHVFELKGKRDPELHIDLTGLKKMGRICEISDLTVPDYDLMELMEDHREDMIGRYIRAFEGKNDQLSRKALYLGLDALLKGE